MNPSPLSAPHLNPNVFGIEPSATLAINERSDALIARGKKVYKLGLGQSPFPVPPTVVEALRRAAPQKDYVPVRGYRPLRETVTEFLHRRHGIERTRRQVLIGPGSKELIFLTQLAYAGELLVPSPSWVSYAPQARIIGRRVTWLPTDFDHDWKLLPETLDAHCSRSPGLPRLLVLNYPNNPTGVSFREIELAALAEVARKHQVLVVSDEIYADLDHEGRTASIAHHYPEGTIVSTGLSKWCGAGGWRLGVFSFPAELEWLCSAMASIASETYTSVNTPVQHAAVVAFQGGPEIDAYLVRCRAILRMLGRRCASVLLEAGCRLPKLDGAFYLFPDFLPMRERLRAKGVVDSRTLAERLLEDTGVATLPGVVFGRPREELTLRLSYVNFDGTAALAAVEGGAAVDEAFLRRHCADTLEAMKRIAEWVG
ncbi:MAG TPA: aminotransferase class I/II-fold pyridoxal phosphate-dependent enzyme [Opitutaceae bacterium]|nr:aminotransferase class I/II-fold pyridoxal phosphate-dependent enzyme [Opitutaceae bacterium]